MTREEAIQYWEGLSKTFSSQLEKEEKYWGRMHLQTSIDAIDTAISALRKQETVTERHELTNAQRIRAMTDEELAGFMRSMMDCVSCEKTFSFKCDGNYNQCLPVCLGWLQQPAEDIANG